MQINGLELPHAFVNDGQGGKFSETRGSWELIEERNSYGEFLMTEIDEIWETVADIERATGELEQDFVGCVRAEDIESYNEGFGASGEISYIWDFSQVLCFASASDDAPFCFDFRENPENPSVIWWADAYWQRIAPDYESFMALFYWKPIEEN